MTVSGCASELISIWLCTDTEYDRWLDSQNEEIELIQQMNDVESFEFSFQAPQRDVYAIVIENPNPSSDEVLICIQRPLPQK